MSEKSSAHINQEGEDHGVAEGDRKRIKVEKNAEYC